MTKEEALEYNKRCAEFIGATPCKDWQGKDGYEHSIFYHSQWSNRFQDYLQLYSYRYSELQFDSDWNWIMEVVDAIEKLGYLFDITANEVGVNSNIMSMRNVSTGGTMNSHNEKYYPTIISVCEEEYSKKEAVVQAINQFLIWYKNQ